jgi:glycosyltransferase involved in cell wall biosynthesis
VAIERTSAGLPSDDASLISIVVPAHNEEEALPLVVAEMRRVMDGRRFEIIVVDDGSSDDTWRVIRGLSERCPQLSGVRFSRNFGHQSAILAGLERAKGACVIIMDADGQHPVELIPTFIEHWQAGFTVVQGVRIGSEDKRALKRLTSAGFYRVFTTLSGLRLPPGATDYWLIGRQCVDEVRHSIGPLLFFRGLISWMGYRTKFVEFHAHQRVAGEPSYTWRRLMHLALNGMMNFSIIPLRLSIIIGVLISLLSFIYLIYIVTVRFTSDSVVPGWASMTGLLSLVGGIQLLMIGVLGEYLGRLFTARLNRPHFVVHEEC